jgi:hypothetical protein
VAHNLRIQAGYYRSIQEDMFKREIFPKLDGSQNRFLEQCYFVDEYTRKRYLSVSDSGSLQNIASILKQKRFDTRWVTLAQKKICSPHLVFQFRNNQFYNDQNLTRQFGEGQQMYDNDARKHTFLLEVELVEAFYGSDIALYRIVNASPEIINKIPSVDLDFTFFEEAVDKFYCLQASPNSPAGRLLNEARIEGMLDHFGIFQDDVDGNYLFEGYRYLIKGYFRFGSSGAPYLYYDIGTNRYIANAIQSEASGIQLAIKNDREGNFQYINAIASPLYIVKEALLRHLTK